MILFHWSVQNSVTFCENVEIQQKQAKSTARLKILHPPTVNDRNNSFVCSCFHKIIQIFLGGLMRNHIVTALFKWLNCFIWNGCIWYWFSTNALIQIVLKPWFKSVLTGRNLLPSLIDVACILLDKQNRPVSHTKHILSFPLRGNLKSVWFLPVWWLSAANSMACIHQAELQQLWDWCLLRAQICETVFQLALGK